MSEQQIAEALGAVNEDLPDNEEQIDDAQLVEDHQDDISDLSPVEQKAWSDGWRPQEQFEGNPDNWKTAEAYNLYGEMQSEIRSAKAETRRKEAEFDARIANLNKLHEAQREAAINDLKAKQRNAVEMADTVEFDRIQTQIDQHEAAPAAEPAPGVDPAIAEWEAKNAWINNPSDEKTIVANSLFNAASARPGATAESALKELDEKLSKLYPEQQPSNPRREMPTMTEQSRRPAGRQRSKELTMNDLTSEERQQWAQFGSIMFNDEKEFLKAVADGRKS